MMSHPRIVLAGIKSGSGKTMITCAMLKALMRGKKLQAFKCGPDYIDPMFHEKVIGVPSRNLDLFFTGEEETRALFLEGNSAELSVIEGVMGLYDGLGGISEEASTYHLAAVLRAPVILIVDAHGIGRSVLALIKGFLEMDREGLIKGVILNQVSTSFYHSLSALIEEELKIKVLGYFPKNPELQWDSRYLGLKLPHEIALLQDKIEAAADCLEKTVALHEILSLADKADSMNPLTAPRFSWLCDQQKRSGQKKTVRIAIARDEAFCFYYEDNLRLLRNRGAELVSFSPLRDHALPEKIHGILLGGGYPELFAKALSDNESMRSSIRQALEQGMPSIAECGGFLYLHEKMRLSDGSEFPMVGMIPGECFDAGRSLRFGYASFRDSAGQFRVRGHEYHYFESIDCGSDWTAKKPVTGREWSCIHSGEGHVWGFGHFYYPSCPEFAAWFVSRCAEENKREL